MYDILHTHTHTRARARDYTRTHFPLVWASLCLWPTLRHPTPQSFVLKFINLFLFIFYNLLISFSSYVAYLYTHARTHAAGSPGLRVKFVQIPRACESMDEHAVQIILDREAHKNFFEGTGSVSGGVGAGARMTTTVPEVRFECLVGTPADALRALTPAPARSVRAAAAKKRYRSAGPVPQPALLGKGSETEAGESNTADQKKSTGGKYYGASVLAAIGHGISACTGSISACCTVQTTNNNSSNSSSSSTRVRFVDNTVITSDAPATMANLKAVHIQPRAVEITAL